MRSFLIRYILPRVWRLSKKRMIRSLQEFSMTELDSGWQSLYAIDYVHETKDKVILFQHAMEEIRHAELFEDLYRSYSDIPLPLPVQKRQEILQDRLDGTLGFFCYMYIGEQTVNADFEHYSRVNIEPKVRNLFMKIKDDEVFHEIDSGELLKSFMKKSLFDVKKAMLMARIQMWKKRYLVFLSIFGEFVMSCLLSILYFVLGFFYFNRFLSRLELNDESHFLFFKKQVEEFRKKIK